jgi:aerobic-type carbon monoxide dehydrogenase small subunit (CoxS/CutS family)
MKKTIEAFNINGRVYDAMITPNMTLSELLREELGLTGTKHACGSGECGSCTVLVDGKPVLSCSTLAITVREKEIVTVEGLSQGPKLDPLQKAFVNHGAVQCGFCSPGMLMMATALLKENPNPTRQEVKEGLGGNLCRCTGYVKIVDAVLDAAKENGTGGTQHG